MAIITKLRWNTTRVYTLPVSSRRSSGPAAFEAGRWMHSQRLVVFPS
jgi:hypothetical protein